MITGKTKLTGPGRRKEQDQCKGGERLPLKSQMHMSIFHSVGRGYLFGRE